MNTEIVLSSLLIYLLFLWAIAKYSESNHYLQLESRKSFDKLIYVFGFGTYCSAWTYYGSIEVITTGGMKFIGVHLGPVISIFLWGFILKKMIRMKERFGITNITDLINVLYSKSRFISTMVTLFFFVGLVPYIALQLKAITKTTHFILQKPINSFDTLDIFIGFSFIFFTIYFGNKNFKGSERISGLPAIIAMESLVKLISLIFVGIYIVYFKFNGFSDIFNFSHVLINEKIQNNQFQNIPELTSWVSILIISSFAFLFLPRQFHVGVIENKNIGDVNTVSWTVPLYLFLLNIFLVPIALYGMKIMPEGISTDLYLLAIPFLENHPILTIIVFLGGYSAAAGMIILEVTTLTSMLANNIVLPILQKCNIRLKNKLFLIKKIIASLLIVISYFYMLVIGDTEGLLGIGLVSFVCVFQLFPTIVGGLFWGKAHRTGAKVSLISGIIIWTYTLFIPTFLNSYSFTKVIVENGPFGISFLKPHALFGVQIFDPITHSVFWSLIISGPLFVIFSIRGKRKEMDSFNLDFDVSTAKRKRDLEVNKTNLFKRINTCFREYYSEEDCNKLINKVQTDLLISNTICVSEFEFLDIIRYLKVKLYQDIGAIATEHEIDKILTPIELNFIEQSNYQAMERQIIAQKKLKSLSQLTSGLAHELNNPINILLNSSKALSQFIHKNEKDSTIDNKILTLNEIITNTTTKAGYIIQKMLIQSRPAELKMSKTFLSLVIEQSIKESKNLAKLEYNLAVSFDFRTNAPQEITYSFQDILRSLNSIIENSIYSMNEKKLNNSLYKPMVNINLIHKAHTSCIEITDNGIGLPNEDLDKASNPFYTTKPSGQGHIGLGLSMASEIIFAHKGELILESEYMKWTKVTIIIPYV